MSTTMQAPAPYTDAPLRIGEPVYTLDNKRLGHVKEFSETHFKVDARFRKDYWLARDRIAYIDDNCVGMTWRSDEAELYKLSNPNTDGYARDFKQVEMPDDPGIENVKDLNYRGRFGV